MSSFNSTINSRTPTLPATPPPQAFVKKDPSTQDDANAKTDVQQPTPYLLPFFITCKENDLLKNDSLEISEKAKQLPISELCYEKVIQLCTLLSQEVPTEISQETKEHFYNLWNSRNRKPGNNYDEFLNSDLFKSKGKTRLNVPVYLYELLFEFQQLLENEAIKNKTKCTFALTKGMTFDLACEAYIDSLKSWGFEDTSLISLDHLKIIFGDKNHTEIRLRLSVDNTDDLQETDALQKIVERMSDFVSLIARKFTNNPVFIPFYRALLEREFKILPHHKGYVPSHLGSKLTLIMESDISTPYSSSLHNFFLPCGDLCNWLYNSQQHMGNPTAYLTPQKFASIKPEALQGTIQQTFFHWVGKVSLLHQALELGEFIELMKAISLGFKIPYKQLAQFMPKSITEKDIVDVMKNFNLTENREETTLAINTFLTLITKDLSIIQKEELALKYLESNNFDLNEVGYRLLINCYANNANDNTLKNLYTYLHKIFEGPFNAQRLKLLLNNLHQLIPNSILEEFMGRLDDKKTSSQDLQLLWIKTLITSIDKSHQSLGIQLWNNLISSSGNSVEIQKSEGLAILENVKNNYSLAIQLFHDFLKKEIFLPNQEVKIFCTFLKNVSNKNTGELLLLVDCLKLVLEHNINNSGITFSDEEGVLNLLGWLSEQHKTFEWLTLLKSCSRVLSISEPLQSLWIKALNQNNSSETQASALWFEAKAKKIWALRIQEQLPSNFQQYCAETLLHQNSHMHKMVFEEFLSDAKAKASSTHKSHLELLVAQTAKTHRNKALLLCELFKDYQDELRLTVIAHCRRDEITENDLNSLVQTLKANTTPLKGKYSGFLKLIRALQKQELYDKASDLLFSALASNSLSISAETRALWISSIHYLLHDSKTDHADQKCSEIINKGLGLSLGNIPETETHNLDSFFNLCFEAFYKPHSDSIRKLLISIHSKFKHKLANTEKPFITATKKFISDHPKRGMVALSNMQELTVFTDTDEMICVLHLLKVLEKATPVASDYPIIQKIAITHLKKKTKIQNPQCFLNLITSLHQNKLHAMANSLLQACLDASILKEPKQQAQLLTDGLTREIEQNSNDTTPSINLWKQGHKLGLWNQQNKTELECLKSFLTYLHSKKMNVTILNTTFEVLDVLFNNPHSIESEDLKILIEKIFRDNLNKEPQDFAEKILKRTFSLIGSQKCHDLLIELLKKYTDNKSYKELTNFIKWIFSSKIHEELKQISDLSKYIDQVEQSIQTLMVSTDLDLSDISLNPMPYLMSPEIIYCLKVIALEKLVQKATSKPEDTKTIVVPKKIKAASKPEDTKIKAELKNCLINIQTLLSNIHEKKFVESYHLKYVQCLIALKNENNSKDLENEIKNSFEKIIPIYTTFASAEEIYDFLIVFREIILGNEGFGSNCLYPYLEGLCEAAEAKHADLKVIHKLASTIKILKIDGAHRNEFLKITSAFITIFVKRMIEQSKLKQDVTLYEKEICHWIDIVLNPKLLFQIEYDNALLIFMESSCILEWISFCQRTNSLNLHLIGYYLSRRLPENLKGPNKDLIEKISTSVITDHLSGIPGAKTRIAAQVLCDEIQIFKEREDFWKFYIYMIATNFGVEHTIEDLRLLLNLLKNYNCLFNSSLFVLDQGSTQIILKSEYAKCIITLVSKLPDQFQYFLSNLPKILLQLDEDTQEEAVLIVRHLLTHLANEKIDFSKKLNILKETYYKIAKTETVIESFDSFRDNIFQKSLSETPKKNPSFLQEFASVLALLFSKEESANQSTEFIKHFDNVRTFFEESFNATSYHPTSMKGRISAILGMLEMAPGLERKFNSPKFKGLIEFSKRIHTSFWHLVSEKESLFPVVKTFINSPYWLMEGLTLFYKAAGENYKILDRFDQVQANVHYSQVVQIATEMNSLVVKNSSFNDVIAQIAFRSLAILFKSDHDFETFIKRSQEILRLTAGCQVNIKEHPLFETKKIITPASKKKEVRNGSIPHEVTLNSKLAPEKQILEYVKAAIAASTKSAYSSIDIPNLMRIFGTPSKEGMKYFVPNFTTMIHELLTTTFDKMEDYQKTLYFSEIALRFLFRRCQNGCSDYKRLFILYAYHPQAFLPENYRLYLECMNSLILQIIMGGDITIDKIYQDVVFQYELHTTDTAINTEKLISIDEKINLFDQFVDKMLSINTSLIPCAIVLKALNAFDNPDKKSQEITLQKIIKKLDDKLFTPIEYGLLWNDPEHANLQGPILFAVLEKFTHEKSRIFPPEFYTQLLQLVGKAMQGCPPELREKLSLHAGKLDNFIQTKIINSHQKKKMVL